MKADTCDLNDANADEEHIREQVVEKFLSNQLRRKLLEKGRIRNFAQLQDTGRTYEDSERSARSMEGLRAEVDKVSLTVGGATRLQRRRGSFKSYGRQICYACGHSGHIAKDPRCPAKKSEV